MSEAGVDFCFEDGEVVARLRWPLEVDAEARVFLRENLLMERLGSVKQVSRVLADLRLPAEWVPGFLADRPFFPPEPPQALAEAVDLDDVVAEFGVLVTRLRNLKKPVAVVLRNHR